MRDNFVRFICIILFVCVGLFFVTKPAHSKTYKILDIDLIDIDNVEYKNEVLRIRFDYLDRDKGARVRWNKKSLDCQCSVYPKTGDINIDKVVIISDRKFLKSYDEIFFINIPSKYTKDFKKGLIECDFVVGWEQLKSKYEFWF